VGGVGDAAGGDIFPGRRGCTCFCFRPTGRPSELLPLERWFTSAARLGLPGIESPPIHRPRLLIGWMGSGRTTESVADRWPVFERARSHSSRASARITERVRVSESRTRGVRTGSAALAVRDLIVLTSRRAAGAQAATCCVRARRVRSRCAQICRLTGTAQMKLGESSDGDAACDKRQQGARNGT
jgi:hypothetical protein